MASPLERQAPPPRGGRCPQSPSHSARRPARLGKVLKTRTSARGKPSLGGVGPGVLGRGQGVSRIPEEGVCVWGGRCVGVSVGVCGICEGACARDLKI